MLKSGRSDFPIIPAGSLLNPVQPLWDPSKYPSPQQIPASYSSLTPQALKAHHQSKDLSGPLRLTWYPGSFEEGKPRLCNESSCLN